MCFCCHFQIYFDAFNTQTHCDRSYAQNTCNDSTQCVQSADFVELSYGCNVLHTIQSVYIHAWNDLYLFVASLNLSEMSLFVFFTD